MHLVGCFIRIYPKSVLRPTLTCEKRNPPDLLGYYEHSAEGPVGQQPSRILGLLKA
jgi:hypothetical protein